MEGMRFALVVRFLGIAVGTLGLFCLLAYLVQRSLMYFPEQLPEARALAQGASEGLEPWRDASGALLGWKARHPSGAAQGRLLVLHGNAGMALDRGYVVRAFQNPALARGWEVFLLEYPGFGARPGHPSETALVDAAVKALNQLRTEGTGPVYVLGESIGSGVACLTAAQRPGWVKGLLLITPFNHMKAVAAVHYPWFPGFLMRDRYPADEALKAYGGPVAILLAERDEVIPPYLGRALFEGYSGPKRLWIEPGATHNTLSYDPKKPLWKELTDYLEGQAH